VRVVDISKQLGSLKAVDHVSLDIAQGSIVTLLGPSGCGKSTTLRLLSGLYKPGSGEILLRKQNVTHLPPNRRKMTMVFQEYALFPQLTVADNVGYGLRMQSVNRTEARGRINCPADSGSAWHWRGRWRSIRMSSPIWPTGSSSSKTALLSTAISEIIQSFTSG
jgi:ABC-type Fe3+/spermidine/putrescine transport system ATPase subunit